ncbi:Transmembrane protein [Orchesella cincta]|uniref:Transmembrane protein 138 n=1 Tax=Orchesella cincta TaxID=48709 RepID=A0A1D2MQZ9_ORCCI|nr:Transmembrane protein [Orchesella cincta]
MLSLAQYDAIFNLITRFLPVRFDFIALPCMPSCDNRILWFQEMKRSQKSSRPGAAGDGSDSVIERASPKHLQDDYFTFNHGNYGDPYSFAPYQHILLAVDFAYNWAMDLSHEEPLAVLVIFIFQSLGILINLILYIMASASRAMQVGTKKHVSIHHWLNLVMSLVYMSLTVWWFIWALRKSWPSVSDQFSFTWPSAIDASSPANTTQSANSTLARLVLNATSSPTKSPAPSSSSSNSEVKEHYTLWSAGFNALYVTHRTVAILYYFIYVRSTFLVLNTPAMENFSERKKHLVGQVKKLCEDDSNNDTQIKSNSSHSRRHHPRSAFSSAFKLDDYLKFNDGVSKEVETVSHQDTQSNAEPSKDKSKRRQILWAENDEVINDTREDSDEEITQWEQEHKTAAKKSNKRSQRSRFGKLSSDNNAAHENEDIDIDTTLPEGAEKENDDRSDRKHGRHANRSSRHH